MISTMSERMLVPEEYQATHTAARNIYDDWYLVPLDLITTKDDPGQFECFRYDSNGALQFDRVYLFRKDIFEF